MEKKIRTKPGPKGKPLSPPLADTYAKVTEGNTRAWTYERALEVDREEADEPEEAPEKLPPAPRPPGARSADFHKKAAPKKRAKQD